MELMVGLRVTKDAVLDGFLVFFLRESITDLLNSPEHSQYLILGTMAVLGAKF